MFGLTVIDEEATELAVSFQKHYLKLLHLICLVFLLQLKEKIMTKVLYMFIGNRIYSEEKTMIW